MNQKLIDRIGAEVNEIKEAGLFKQERIIQSITHRSQW
jgi:hypothetical protein